MLIDTFNRTIDYIRVSVTKQCNFRCAYCMPDTPLDFHEVDDMVELDKLASFLKVAIDEGVKKVRITGGEPLLRKGLSGLIKSINTYDKSVDIAITTNAFYLEKYAKELKNAGLKRLNISLDTLDAKKFASISKIDALPRVIAGIDLARSLGIKIKLNCVPMRGVNDSELIDLLEFAAGRGIMIRFIEFMENEHAKEGVQGLKEHEILEIIGKKYEVKQIEKDNMGPAKLYEAIGLKSLGSLKEGGCAFGVIAPHNDDFCKSCNRIRLSSEGVICPCLYFQDSLDVKSVIESGDRELMIKALKAGVFNKPEKNNWSEEEGEANTSARAFYYTGG